MTKQRISKEFIMELNRAGLFPGGGESNHIFQDAVSDIFRAFNVAKAAAITKIAASMETPNV